MEAPLPASQSIREGLARVLSSAGFVRSERQAQFLRFLVETQLDGRGHELKESVIGVAVFGREPGYDPKIDGIVRTEAIRLRSRLAKYYAAEGSADPLIIELPKGGYRPIFRKLDHVPLPEDAPAKSSRSWWMGGALATIILAAIIGWAWPRTNPGSVTVAVLPLENLSPDAESGYFSEGLTDEVIRNLSHIEGLTVRSRASSFALKGQRLNVVDAGRQLSVDFLVEGSVLQEGDRLRVNVALIRVSDETRLWSNRFDRTLPDIFAIQDDISRGIANVLRLKLGAGRRRYDTNLEAYDLYLRGRHAMESFPAAGRNVALGAVQYFQQAIAKDASYAIAYTGVADALLAIDQNIVNPEAYRRAKVAAERAMTLDPMLSEAHSAVASIRAREYDWPAAERGYRRAIALNPNNALAHLQLGFSVLILQGRLDEGLAEARQALTLDPLSPYVNTEVGRALLWTGHTDEAIEQLRRAITLDARRGRPYVLLSRALTLSGKAAAARAVLEEARAQGQLTDGGPGCDRSAETGDHSSAGAPRTRVRSGGQGRALVQPAADEPLEVRELVSATRGASAARNMARQYACRADTEQAIEYLEKALAQNEPGLAEIVQSPNGYSPEWSAIRSHSRFASLRQKMHLPPVSN